MPGRSLISRLPATVRDQLNRRLAAAAFGDIVGQAAWLTAKGYPVGKSSVGVYAKKYRAEITAEEKRRHRQPDRDTVAIRLACLVAAANSQGSTASIVERAEAYAAWVGADKAPQTG